MKEIASWALETAKLRGASLAEARIVDRARPFAGHQERKDRQRLRCRVAGHRYSRDRRRRFRFRGHRRSFARRLLQGCAARAVEIAKGFGHREVARAAHGSRACRQSGLDFALQNRSLQHLASKRIWSCCSPSTKSLRKTKGVTLAETNMNFRRYEQWFFSTEGSEIHQTTITSGAGYAAYSFQGTEIQKRSYPNSYGGQFQNAATS